jgi:hypothetical protein
MTRKRDCWQVEQCSKCLKRCVNIAPCIHGKRLPHMLNQAADIARHVVAEMCPIGPDEVGLVVFEGFSPRLAEQAAKNNLKLWKKDLDEEVITELAGCVHGWSFWQRTPTRRSNLGALLDE